MTEEDWQWETGTPHERGQIVRSFWGVAPKSNMTTLFNLTEDGLSAILAGGDWKSEYVAYDRRPDNTGLDDGPYLPGRAPRKRPVRRTDLSDVRKRAWETRYTRYGRRGHR